MDGLIVRGDRSELEGGALVRWAVRVGDRSCLGSGPNWLSLSFLDVKTPHGRCVDVTSPISEGPGSCPDIPLSVGCRDSDGMWLSCLPGPFPP